MLLPEVANYHREQVVIAANLYAEAASSESEGRMWSEFKKLARRSVKVALRETNYLRDVTGALTESSRPTAVLRFLTAPPKSQDQFRLLCRQYSKSAENTGNPLGPEKATAVAAAFLEWRDRELTSWLDTQRNATRQEVRALLHHAGPLIAQQKIQTRRRMDASNFQEETVADMLLDSEWTYLDHKIIHRGQGIPCRHFLRKARFTAGSQTKEIDVAIGLGQAYILALECKVSNDSTNSTKRINDVSDKAKAWREEYGRSLKTGALLQGVYRAEDVLGLVEGGVEVFWFHDLPRLSRWIATELKE